MTRVLFKTILLDADPEIVMVDLALGDDFFEQTRSMGDSGTVISDIEDTHKNSIGSRMPPVSLKVLRVHGNVDHFDKKH